MHRQTDTCDRAVAFLLQQQSVDGCWSDWSLPPGPSEAWTTAYIATQLASVRPEQRLRTQPAVARAAQWLISHECENGGWNYNKHVDADADSTAWAIILLRAVAFEFVGASRERLLSFRQCDGGFATYPSDAGLGSWGRSHPDVTAIAVKALIDKSSNDHTCEDALRYLNAQRRGDGLWNSFWWVTPLYATAACLELLGRIDPVDDGSTICATLRIMPVSGAFDTALLLLSLIHVQTITASHNVRSAAADERIATLRAWLIEQQLRDGSWPVEPVLRVTDRMCVAPWQQLESGVVYADEKRLFTSATVLRALNAAVVT